MERHVAGHATHFLRRLDRASDAHIELALTLYRDAELLAETLVRAKVPPGAERVAISLADRSAPRIGNLPPGPYVVVTREGRFVTCLAADMSPGDLFVVGRERLDVAVASVERMRERLAAIDALSEKEGEAQRLYKRVQQVGHQFAREDFEALARFEPLLGGEFFRGLFDIEGHLLQAMPTLFLLRRNRLRDADRALLRAWWDAFWGWSHQSVLALLGDVSGRMTHLERVLSVAPTPRGPLDQESGLYLLMLMPAHTTIIGPSVRAMWTVGRSARHLLRMAKRPPPSSSFAQRLPRDASLAVIALASQKFRAEAVSAIGAAPASTDAKIEAMWAGVRNGLRLMVDADPAANLAALDQEGRELVATWLEDPQRRENAPITVKGPDDVPVEVARAALSTLENSYLDPQNDWMTPFLQTVPWVARARPEELFAPRAWCASLTSEYSDDDALDLVDRLAPVFGPEKIETVRAEKKPGRNDPCSCGSGKKYKRCCGG